MKKNILLLAPECNFNSSQYFKDNLKMVENEVRNDWIKQLYSGSKDSLKELIALFNE